VAVIPSISAVVTDPGAVTDLVQEIDPGAATDPVQVVDRDLVLGQGKDLVQEVGAVADQVPEQDPARDRNRVQVQDQARDKDRVRVTKVPLVANGIVEALHPETVNAVHPVVLANQDQGAHRAGAEVVVAEVAVADVDVDLK